MEDHLHLNGPWKYQRSALDDDPVVTAAMEKIAAEVFGEPLSIVVQSEAKPAAPPKEQQQIREDPVLKAFQKHLGGEVVESRRSK